MTHTTRDCATLAMAAAGVLEEYAKVERPDSVTVLIPPQDGRLVTSTTLEEAIRDLHCAKTAAAGAYGQKPPPITALAVELAWPDPVKGCRFVVRA